VNKFTVGLIVLRVATKLLRLFVIGLARVGWAKARSAVLTHRRNVVNGLKRRETDRLAEQTYTS